MNEPIRFCNSADDNNALADPARWVAAAVARCGEYVNHAAHPDWQAFCTAAASVLACQGITTLDDPKRLRNALNDCCKGAFKREVNVSILCARAGLLAPCARHSGAASAAFHIRRMVSILTDEHGVAPDLAAFITGVWSTLCREFHDPSPRAHASPSSPSQPVVPPKSTPSHKAGDTHTVDLGGGVNLEMVWCPAGSFQMGSNDGKADEKPVRTVRITKPFWMGKFEVTQAQWRSIMGDSPSHFKGDDLPVENVSWTHCVEFCQKLTERERTAGRLPAGYVYRLPTEAEWEYAARGGSKSRNFTYSGGNDLGAVGWFRDNSGGKTQPVGKKTANELGLYDMSGNVLEWCQDDWHDSYAESPSDGSRWGDGSGSDCVYRGGSWLSVDSLCRSAFRSRVGPSYWCTILGFRLVLAPVPVTNQAKPSALSQPVASAISTPPRKDGDTHTVDLDGGVNLEMVWCPAGSFQMGSNDGSSDEKPVRTVQLTKGFWMGRTEVTQAQWRQLMKDNPSCFKGDDLPVEEVGWTRCVEFCRTLTERERTTGRLPAGYVYRLPTEAEWEYAARGGPKSRGFTYSGGNDLGAVGWFKDNSGKTTHPVGKKTANELGLYDMSGNVWEWCQDWYQENYHGLGSVGPSGPASGSLRVYRGGGWFLVASFCRSAYRGGRRPSFTSSYLGFRVVLAPVP